MTKLKWLPAALLLFAAAPVCAADQVPLQPSQTAESCHTFKAAPGAVFSLGGYAGQAEWIMVFNATTPPADGSVSPVAWGYAGAAGSWSIAWLNPAPFNVGVTACYSSTGPFMKTAISTNNAFSGQVQ